MTAVLHVETGRHLYGGALQVAYLVEERARTGAAEDVVVCPRGSALEERLGGVCRVVPLPAAGDLDLRFAAGLIRCCRETRPDIVHVHSRRGADIWGPLAARCAGIPAVVTRRVDNPEPSWWARRKYGCYAAVAVISGAIRRVLEGEGVPPQGIATIYSAVDTHRNRPGGGSPRAAEGNGGAGAEPPGTARGGLLEELGLPRDALLVGVIAQFIPRKGHRYLLEAVPQVLERLPEARVLLFGQGPLEEEIAGEIRRRGLEDAVRLMGFRGDLEEILPVLDVVVHPALMEGLGVALLQAAACGVPVERFSIPRMAEQYAALYRRVLERRGT